MNTRHVLVADTVYAWSTSPSLKWCVAMQTLIAKEYIHGSSSWLTVLPILKHGFHLHKGDFWDVLSLQYSITPSNTQVLPSVEPLY